MSAASFSVYAIKIANNSLPRYIGVTSKPLNIRLNQHIKYAEKHIEDTRPICNWIRKHINEEIFITKIDSGPVGDWNYLYYVEKYWIAFYKELGYNLLNSSPGGRGGKSFIHTEEAKQKIKQSQYNENGIHKQKGRKVSEKSKQQMSKSHLGIPLTEQCKITMSDGRRKNKNHPLWNKKHSPEAIEKMRLASTNRIHTEEEKEKRRLAMKNRPKISGHSQYHFKNNILVPGCIWCEDLVVNIGLDFSTDDEIRKIHKNYVRSD